MVFLYYTQYLPKQDVVSLTNLDNIDSVQQIDKTDPEYIESLKQCEKKILELEKFPLQITLFSKIIHRSGINCDKDLTDDSMANDYMLHNADYYTLHGTEFDIVAVYKSSISEFWNTKSPIGTQSPSLLGLDSEGILMPVQDITNYVELPQLRKDNIWKYKIILSVWPTWDTPRNDWTFVISLIWSTWDLIYSLQSSGFVIPKLSDLIKQVNDYSANLANTAQWNTENLIPSLIDPLSLKTADKLFFDTLSQSMVNDVKSQEVDYAKEIRLTSMKYIGKIIENNKEYKTFVNIKLENLIKNIK